MLVTLAALRVNYLNTVILLYNRHKFTAFSFVRRGSVAVIALGVPSDLVCPLYRVVSLDKNVNSKLSLSTQV